MTSSRPTGAGMGGDSGGFGSGPGPDSGDWMERLRVRALERKVKEAQELRKRDIINKENETVLRARENGWVVAIAEIKSIVDEIYPEEWAEWVKKEVDCRDEEIEVTKCKFYKKDERATAMILFKNRECVDRLKKISRQRKLWFAHEHFSDWMRVRLWEKKPFEIEEGKGGPFIINLKLGVFCKTCLASGKKKQKDQNKEQKDKKNEQNISKTFYSCWESQEPFAVQFKKIERLHSQKNEFINVMEMSIMWESRDVEIKLDSRNIKRVWLREEENAIIITFSQPPEINHQHNSCRATDPTEQAGNAFGNFLSYRIACDSHESFTSIKGLLCKVLNRWQIKDGEDVKEDSILINEIHNKWSHGYDGIFSRCSFTVRYYLHVLFAQQFVISCRSKAGRIANKLQQMETGRAERILKRMCREENIKKNEDELLEILSKLSDEEENRNRRRDLEIKRVFITPLKVCPQLPEYSRDNRILRNYPKGIDDYQNRFVRVSFVDENFSKLYGIDHSKDIEKRITAFLRDGLIIGGEKFVFLGYSNSQMRQRSCWFYCESGEGIPSANDIRESIGKMKINGKPTAKDVSRIALAFSTTRDTITVDRKKMKEIDDIERGGVIFSEGCGLISSELAERISNSLNIRPCSAFQIHYLGFKGVVSVGCTGGHELMPRKSMKKFFGNGKHDKLEVLQEAKPIKCYTNRQIITLLTSLGVRDDVFVELAKNMKADLLKKHEFPSVKYYGDNIVDELLSAGFKPDEEPFLKGLIRCYFNRLCNQFHKKTRMLVESGITLLGVVDETEALEEGEVYFSSKDVKLKNGQRILAYRCPCLHPGDCRILRYSDPPSLHHLKDVVVFSSKGKRPPANEMSGGDYDGDIFNLIWDTKLIPTETFDPMSPEIYKQSEPEPAEVSEASFNDKVEDLKNNFVQFIKNDIVGEIATLHLAVADSEEEGAKSAVCIKLAECHSTAVDSSKTGEPVTKKYRMKEYPSFMENLHHGTYESKKVLGTIYKMTKDILSHLLNGEYQHQPVADPHLITNNDKEKEKARKLLEEYNKQLKRIMITYEVYDESELISGYVQKFAKKISYNGEKRDNEELLKSQVKKLQREFRTKFYDSNTPKRKYSQKYLEKAKAWYTVAYEQPPKAGNIPPLISFPWVVSDVLCKIKKNSISTSTST